MELTMDKSTRTIQATDDDWKKIKARAKKKYKMDISSFIIACAKPQPSEVAQYQEQMAEQTDHMYSLVMRMEKRINELCKPITVPSRRGLKSSKMTLGEILAELLALERDRMTRKKTEDMEDELDRLRKESRDG
jgi:hypothetical protein